MTESSIELSYEASPPRRNLRSVIQPRHFAWAAGIAALLTLLMPVDIGSGRVVVNPLRIAGCVTTVAFLLAYVELRLWRERYESGGRAALFGVCTIICTASFAYAHWSYWGDEHTPSVSAAPDYWNAWLIFAAAILTIVLFNVAWQLWRWWLLLENPNDRLDR